MVRTFRGFAIAALLAAPLAASASSVRIEGFYGWEQPPAASFSAAVGSTGSASNLYRNGLQLAGGDLLVNLGGLELGAIIDTTFGSDSGSQTALGALLGAGLELGPAKLDLLAEAGGHRYGNFASSPDIVTSSTTEQWLFYVGLRPGVSVKLAGPLSVGVWAFVRWDVNSQDVPVTVGSARSAGSYSLGGTTIGATLRLGFDL